MRTVTMTFSFDNLNAVQIAMIQLLTDCAENPQSYLMDVCDSAEEAGFANAGQEDYQDILNALEEVGG